MTLSESMKLADDIADKSPVTLRESISEFAGTALLVFTVGCNVLAGSASWGALSIAAVLAVLIYTLAPISGAHLNPAVSVALGACGKCPWKKVGAYAALQTLGGFLGGTSYLVVISRGIVLQPTTGHMLWQAAIAETLYTCMLCLVVLNVAASKKHGGSNGYYGIAIGGVIAAGAYSGGSISKGCFNPAVALGIDASGGGMIYALSYVLFELLGAGMAAGIFKLCRPEDFDVTPREDSFDALKPKLAAEFVGTFFLMLTVGLDIVSGAHAAAISIAAALSCMIFALGSVSGGHFNPAVTLAVFVAGGKDAPPKEEAAAYVGTQMVAGLLASLMSLAMESGQAVRLAPVNGFFWMQALPCEVIFTYVLAFTVLSVTAKTDDPAAEFAPLAIGLTIICGGLACGGISGGVLNPAVAAGIAFSHALMGGGFLGLAGWFPYALAQLLGGVLAAGAFRYSRAPADGSKATGGWYGSLA